MNLEGIGGEFYGIAFEGARAASVSPYKKIRDWTKQYDFLNGQYVRVNGKGRDTDLRTVGRHHPDDEDLFHAKFPHAFYVQAEDYGILLRPVGRQTRSGGASKYHVAGIIGLENISLAYGDIVNDEGFEFVAKELDEFTDIDSFLSEEGVYVDEVNAENAGSPTFKYRRNTPEPEREMATE